jgi:hypothetical protein
MKWLKKIFGLLKRKKNKNNLIISSPLDPTSDWWDEIHFGDHSIF